MRMHTTFARSAMSVLAVLSIATYGRAQSSFGMAPFVASIEETAGTSPSTHFCDLKIGFTGPPPTVYDYSDSPGTHQSDPPSMHMPTGNFSITNIQWQFFVPSASGTNYIKYGGSSTATASDAYGVYSLIPFRYPASTTLGTSFKGLLTGKKTVESWTLGPPNIAAPYTGYTVAYGHYWTINIITTYEEVTYDPYRLRQIPLDIASVDSRKTFAPPDKDGAYAAVDPNAESRNATFAGWAYNGGLFVGNANGVNGDQSGVSRIQALVNPPVGLPNCFYSLSLLNLGTPSFFKSAKSQWDGAMSLQAYIPTGTASPNVAISALNWSNAMDPATSTAIGSAIDLSTVPANEYINYPIGTTMPIRILLKATDETNARWHYFGGPTYDLTPSTYPYSECKPHLWACETPVSPVTVSSTSLPNSGAWY